MESSLGMLYWIEKHPGLASWVQALGSIIAIAIAIAVPWWQKRQAMKQAQDVDRAQLRHLLHTLLDEITVAVEAFKEEGDNLLATEAGTPIRTTIPLLENPFPIYHACMPKLGQIPDEGLRKLVIIGYGRAIGFVASVRFNNVLIERQEQAEYLQAIRPDVIHKQLLEGRSYVLNHYGDSLRSSYREALDATETMQVALRGALTSA